MQKSNKKLFIYLKYFSSKCHSLALNCYQIIALHVYYSKKDYQERLRRIAYSDEKKNKKLVFLTNNFTLPALTITELYQPLAERVVLQRDQAASANKSILWNVRKCGQEVNMDCDLRLCAGSDHQKAIEVEAESLHNFTDYKRNAFRENATIANAYRC